MTPRQARLGVDIFTGLVAASVGVALAGLTWRLAGDPGQRLGASPVAARPQRPVDIGPLVALAPFGAAAPQATAMQATNQPLTLRGILMAQPRAASSALISVGDAAPVAFYIGQAVGSSTIDAIEADHVVLLSGGARTILAFPKADSGSGGIAAAGTTGPAAPAPAAGTPPAAPPAPNGALGGAALLGALGPGPNGDGYVVGQQVSQAARSAGLLPGDQVVAVNGTPVADAIGNVALLQSAAAAGTARIDIIRAGQRLTLSVPFK